MKESLIDPDLSVYEDAEFIARKYEEIKDTSPTTTITNSQSNSGVMGAGILGLNANMSGSSQVSRSYSISTTKMLKEIYLQLLDYPEFSGEYKLTPMWFSGNIGMGSTERIKERREYKSDPEGTESSLKREVLGEHDYLGLSLSEHEFVPLFTKQNFFMSGYHQILENVHGPSSSIWLAVRMLGKTLFNNPYRGGPVIVPYLIYAGSEISKQDHP